MLHPQKCIPEFLQQTLFVKAYHLAQEPVTVSLCKYTTVSSCGEPCALLNMVVATLWQQCGWTS